MKAPGKTLQIGSSPHIRAGHSTDKIMLDVVLALLPVTAFAVYAFGLAALLTLATAIASCVATERVACWLRGRPSTLGDWSVVITGLLYGLTLPPGLPLWMTAVGGMIGVGVAKSLFGGLGYNAFNPALVGRAILQAAFPIPMTTWMATTAPDRFISLPSSTLAPPLAKPTYDAVTGATPLSAWKFDKVAAETPDLFAGLTTGSVGETAAWLILLGGVYLVARNRMNWRIPASILGSVFVFSGLLYLLDPATYASPVFMLFSGGLMLGAVFMASDMVGSPITNAGTVLYGVLIALLVVVIRTWGGMPEGVMYAILLGNAVAPHVDNWIQPRVYGTRPRRAG